MRQWWRRVRGALGLGALWAAGGFAIGGVFELIDNVAPGVFPFIARVDMWPQTLAIPGFFGGVLFAVVLGVAGRKRRFDELSLPRFTVWGAIAGMALGGIGMSFGAPFLFVGITSVLGASGAAASLALARRSEDRLLAVSAAEVSTIGLTPEEARELLGPRDP